MGDMSDMCFEQGWHEAGESWSVSREYYRPRRYYNPIPLEAWIRLQRGDPTKAFPLDEDEKPAMVPRKKRQEVLGYFGTGDDPDEEDPDEW